MTDFLQWSAYGFGVAIPLFLIWGVSRVATRVLLFWSPRLRHGFNTAIVWGLGLFYLAAFISYANKDAAPPDGGDPDTLHVSRSELGSQWPFTIDDGEVVCMRLDEGDLFWGPESRNVLLLKANGRTYGLNIKAHAMIQFKGKCQTGDLHPFGSEQRQRFVELCEAVSDLDWIDTFARDFDIRRKGDVNGFEDFVKYVEHRMSCFEGSSDSDR